MSYANDIKKMHKHHEISYEGPPKELDGELLNLRFKLIEEEYWEFVEASQKNDREATLDALVDLVVVAIGCAEQVGWDFDQAWTRVLLANLQKYPAKSAEDIARSKRKIVNDLVKPEGWKAPSLKDLVHG